MLPIGGVNVGDMIMQDLMMIGLCLALFGLAIGFAHACEGL